MRYLAAALLALALPSSALAQGRLQPVEYGDGRIHGAPSLEVTEQDLHPGQVQTINLHPRYHSVLEFPYPIAQVHAGDPDVFISSIVGNKLTLKATKVVEAETSMSVILSDADLTVVPFLVRTDSSSTPLYVVRYTDPLEEHLNMAEREIALRLSSSVDERVDRLADERLYQRLLSASEVVDIDKREFVGSAGNRFGLEVLSAQEVPDNDGQPRLYLRYRVYNQTVAPLTDLHFIPRVQTTERTALLFEKTSVREVYDVRDVRFVQDIPAGTATDGMLIMAPLDLTDAQSLSIEAVGFNGQRRILIERVLVGAR